MTSPLNPWDRLAAKVPSTFASDPRFTLHKTCNTSENPANEDLGVLSAQGKAGYLMRATVRKGNITIGKRYEGEIPKALRYRKTEERS